MDISLTNSMKQTCIHIACKQGVKLEILEMILVNLRTMYGIDQIKEFLSLKDNDAFAAIDYCMFKKRKDMIVLLEQFVDKE